MIESMCDYSAALVKLGKRLSQTAITSTIKSFQSGGTETCISMVHEKH